MAHGERVARGTRGLKLAVLAVGKAGRGPEAELVARYQKRADGAGRAVGLAPVVAREVSDGTGPTRREAEAARLLAAHPGGTIVLLDETGVRLTSVSLSQRLSGWQSEGVPQVSFLIGGADGHGEAARAAATEAWSLSDLTLPHLLARVVLLEQIYRAITILSGHPYHRGAREGSRA